MSHSDLFLIVIAGGSGTRFWPKSTSKRPKQFLKFGKSHASLLAKTVNRFEGWVPHHQQWIVTTASLKSVTESENLRLRVLAEPQARNTAPCIYWAAREVSQVNPNGVMLVMPADHSITQVDAFQSVVRAGVEWARSHDDLVTLGVSPTRAETGYGYLRLSDDWSAQSQSHSVRRVEAFVEKPNRDTAEQFLRSGNYLWNGGMFIWRAQVILKAFDEFMPEMRRAWEASGGNITEAYSHLTATSIDYGVMEKANNVVTLPLECGWDDLGSWTSVEMLAQSLGAQQGENTVLGGAILSVDSRQNVIDVPAERLVALLGVENLIVVEQGSSLLVADKSRAQEIRRIVDELKKSRPDLI